MIRCFALGLLAIVACQPAAAASAYRITNLGTFSGLSFSATSVNDLGHVAGFVGGSAFVYRDGTISDLGTLGGIYSRAFGIDNAGQVVGNSYNAQTELRGFVHHGGEIFELNTLGGEFSSAYAISSAGVIVGSSATLDGDVRAVRWTDVGPVGLGTIGGSYSQARAISSNGQITGQSDNTRGDRHAFLYRDGVMHDLGTLGGNSSFGYGINDTGWVVGQSTDIRGQQRAFIYDGVQMRELSGLIPDAYAVAFDINNVGLAVGNSWSDADRFSAVLFDPVLGTLDLNDLIAPGSGWVLSEAIAINEVGQIIGTASFNGQPRSYLLTPIPLPAALPLLACALLFLVGFRPVRRDGPLRF